jgi:hypothetical protein
MACFKFSAECYFCYCLMSTHFFAYQMNFVCYVGFLEFVLWASWKPVVILSPLRASLSQIGICQVVHISLTYIQKGHLVRKHLSLTGEIFVFCLPSNSVASSKKNSFLYHLFWWLFGLFLLCPTY